MLTSSPHDEDIIEATGVGANGYVIKPLNADDFAALATTMKSFAEQGFHHSPLTPSGAAVNPAPAETKDSQTTDGRPLPRPAPGAALC